MTRPVFKETGRCRTCGSECVALTTRTKKVTWCEKGHVIAVDETGGKEVYNFHK